MQESLDYYDILPEDMMNYLRYNGRHFNKKLLEFAVDKMTTKEENGEEKKLQPMTKKQLENLLDKYSIKLENNVLYDAVYVANMCKADFLGSSVIDEGHLALYVKDVIDDVDGYEGLVFNRWYADTVRKGIPVDWSEVL